MNERARVNDHLIQAVFYGNPDRYPPIINGARLLAWNGFKVDVLSRETGENWSVSYPERVRIRRTDMRATSSWREYLGFVTQVLRSADKSAFCFMAHDMHAFFPTWLLAKFLRRPLVYQIHELVDSTSQHIQSGGRLVYEFHRRFAKTADLIIVPDQDRANIIEESLELGQPILVVANSPLKRKVVSGQHLRQSLLQRGLDLDGIVLRQGSLGPSHAIETTIRSMPMWNNQKWGFVVIGPGSQDYFESIQAIAAEMQVLDRFVILPPVGYDDIFSFTCGAHVGHSLYSPVDSNNRYSTTASNKLMEYMAVGLPVLVSDRPSLRKFVEKYQCGVPADESSPASIAEAVNFLLGNLDRAHQMGTAARLAFEQEFCYERQFAPAVEAFRALS